MNKVKVKMQKKIASSIEKLQKYRADKDIEQNKHSYKVLHKIRQNINREKSK